MPHGSSGIRIHGQGRAYAAVIGVTAGMLFAGLAVPLAFGRMPNSRAGTQSVGQLDPSFTGGPTGGPVPTLSGGSNLSGGPSTRVPGSSSFGPGGTVRPGVTFGPTAGPGSSTGGSGPLTASDVGVTATTVKIGVVLLDIQALTPLGFAQPHFTPQEQQKQAQVFIDQVNNAGGLAGRRLVPDWKTYNPVDKSGNTSQAAVCKQLGGDDKVFAAIGFVGANGTNISQCLSQQYGIPSISHSGDIAEAYRKGHYMIVTPYQELERGSANWGDLAVKSGLVRGRKIGTLSNSDPAETRPEAALVQTLQAGGATVAYRAHLSNDIGTGQSQMPVEVRNMQLAGVDTVFLGTNFIQALQFVQTADGQQFKPLYVVSDLGSLTVRGLVADMPASFDGAYGFTQVAANETPQDKQCRLAANRAMGTNYTPDDSGATKLWCWMLPVLDQAADHSGPSLTRKGLAGAFPGVDGRALPLTIGGSFRQGKTDFADYLRPVKYSRACKCYQPAGAPQRGRY